MAAQGVLFRLFGRFIPSEESRLARWIKKIVFGWKIGKVLLVAGGMVVIYNAGHILYTAYAAMPAWLMTNTGKVAVYFLPLFLELLKKSLTYLWQPILVYLAINLLTHSPFWRRFWCLVGVAWFLLSFVSAFEHVTWKEYSLLALLSMQGYVLLLWFLPRELWNIVGLTFSMTLGLIVLLLPDLPTTFDDFGMFGAILAFFMGYLNALASLIQRIAKRL